MKFLCPSCKAKYQIADEKVIGRTVKMKCRHCGHLIEINEAVIGGPSRPSTVPPTPTGVVDSSENPPPNLVAPKAKPPPKPGSAVTSATATPAGARGAAESREAEARKLSSPTMGAVRAIPVPADRSRGSAVHAPRPSPKTETTDAHSPSQLSDRGSRESKGPSSQRGATPRAASVGPAPASTHDGGSHSLPGGSAVAKSPERSVRADTAAAPAPSATVARGHGADSIRPVRPDTSEPSGVAHDALAGAFAKAVTESTEHPLAGDEWYVGVNEQPIGPIRLADIRDRAARGEVTADCLVWRDGFEDWKPLLSFPELVAVVEEGIASQRSLRPPLVTAATGPAAPAAHASAQNGATAIAVSPMLGSGTWTGTAPAGSGAVSRAVATSSTTFEDDAAAVPGLAPPKIPVAAWLAVLMALGLGVTIGLVFLKPAPPKEIVKYVQVPAASQQPGGVVAAPAPAANGQSDQAAANHDVVSSNADKRSTGAARKATSPTGAGNEAPVAAASSEVTQGLKGLQGLQGLGGPRTGPGNEVSASSAGRQQLDSATLSRTVSRYTASVKRSCWQPALDSRAPDAATSARISANIVVAPSGKVQNVTVSPDPKGYRGLSSCIQSRVRNWEFPPAGGSTEFNVPFVFAAQ